MQIPAFGLAFAGLTGLCLAMPRHYRQWRSGHAPALQRHLLRIGGWLLLALSAWASMRAWGAGSGLAGWLGIVTAAGLLLVWLLPYAVRWIAPLAGAGAVLGLGALLSGCAGARPEIPDASAPRADDSFGVMVMAHGGPPEWNEGVLDAVQPLRERYRIEVAFGMADAASMQQAVDRLQERGADRIGVVRLFVSGESWRERTEKILGLRDGAPPRPAGQNDAADAHHGGHAMALWRLDSDAAFAMSREGLSEADAMGPVLADRARALSRDPAREDVLILAHGPADDAENARWLARIDARAGHVRRALPFRRVQVETLREDWPDKRAEVSRRIRAFVQRAAEEDGRALVIPFRVHGFGPYARVLEGLDYEANGTGLIPHPNVTAWIEQQIALLETALSR